MSRVRFLAPAPREYIMILIDYTQVVLGSIIVSLNRGEDLDDKLVRHITLNNLRYYRSRFKEEYGELVICTDDKHYWRRDYFPNYKANRKKDRESSPYDWNEIFSAVNMIRDELDIYFPYKVLHIDGAEADDIIAVVLLNRAEDKNIIISSDKDFIQLHRESISQYSPVTKKVLNGENPQAYLKEHIIKGDRSDGVPNVLSSDDTFISEKRQKPIRKTTIVTLLEAMNEYDPETLYQIAKCNKDTWVRNWQRNETLIDLTKIPEEIVENILYEFDGQVEGYRNNLLNYFIDNKLNSLIKEIQEF
tara:strand:- start:386 stop:1297 length:912 start_codon:yes stop_codon:yes gene_type:complete